MKNSALRRYFLCMAFVVSFLFGRDEITLIEYIPFPNLFDQMGFTPDKIQIGFSNQIYLLDQDSRQICRLSSNQEILFYGGFGQGEHTFFDPVWMGFFPNGLWILDRTENQLIQLDFRLNKIQTLRIQKSSSPDLASMDPSGEIYLLSNQERIVHTFDDFEMNNAFITFNDFDNLMPCIQSMHINEAGVLGLFSSCDNTVHFFNRIGRRFQVMNVRLSEPKFLLSIREEWLLLNEKGEGLFLDSGEKIKLPGIVGTILDVTSKNRTLIILSKDQVLYLNVPQS
ncbi:MAG: hypothetical protein HN462_02230 [Candidatus Marinimicrobia bacterium]|jgi:hypothetical protein|nr:hypothetical protein [Candidatus Neomarinimicrobiota bacterium]